MNIVMNGTQKLKFLFFEIYIYFSIRLVLVHPHKVTPYFQIGAVVCLSGRKWSVGL